MSSVTISMTVWDDCQPWVSRRGLNTRINGSPAMRFWASVQQEAPAPNSISGLEDEISAGGTLA